MNTGNDKHSLPFLIYSLHSLYSLYSLYILSIYSLYILSILSLYTLYILSLYSLYTLYTLSILSLYSLYCLFSREPFQLPWGARRAQSNSATGEDKPGAFVLKKLFTDFTYLASRKIEQVLAESLVRSISIHLYIYITMLLYLYIYITMLLYLYIYITILLYLYIYITILLYLYSMCTQEKPLQKSLQRGEDSQLDQLLSTLNAVAEHCLPSLLKTLFAWQSQVQDERVPRCVV